MNRSFLVLTIDSKELSYVFTDDLRCMCSLAYHSPLSSKTHRISICLCCGELSAFFSELIERVIINIRE